MAKVQNFEFVYEIYMLGRNVWNTQKIEEFFFKSYKAFT